MTLRREALDAVDVFEAFLAVDVFEAFLAVDVFEAFLAVDVFEAFLTVDVFEAFLAVEEARFIPLFPPFFDFGMLGGGMVSASVIWTSLLSPFLLDGSGRWIGFTVLLLVRVVRRFAGGGELSGRSVTCTSSAFISSLVRFLPRFPFEILGGSILTAKLSSSGSTKPLI